ncbi:hypothetical protein LZ30DRAFT_306170 [Colletotrichum cereale]|nr:hypothetical protein LZ30DRAFT_306170 [Colletotrichum cereale]
MFFLPGWSWCPIVAISRLTRSMPRHMTVPGRACIEVTLNRLAHLFSFIGPLINGGPSTNSPPSAEPTCKRMLEGEAIEEKKVGKKGRGPGDTKLHSLLSAARRLLDACPPA